jgi:hypothetical protein
MTSLLRVLIVLTSVFSQAVIAGPIKELEQLSSQQVAQYWFKRTIDAESGVKNARTDEERIAVLRQWAYKEINRGSPQCLLDVRYGYKIYERPPSQVLYLAHKHGLGYYCGGTADLLADIYALYGYQSGTINVGDKKSFSTHVTTLVALPSGIVSMQDAYFGFELRTVSGKIGDFEDFLKALAKGKADDFVFKAGNTHCKPFVALNSSWPDRLRTRPLWYYGKALEGYDDRQTRCHQFSLENFINLDPKFLLPIEKITGHKGFAYIFTLPIGATGIGKNYLKARH